MLGDAAQGEMLCNLTSRMWLGIVDGSEQVGRDAT